MSSRKPYSILRAELVAEQIRRFDAQHLHQLAGHRANLDFWVDEAAAALRTIDEYEQRFRRLRGAQVSWVKEHDTRVTWYCPVCQGGCEFGPAPPERPWRIPAEDLAEARSAVRLAMRRFLLRLHRAGLIAVAELNTAAERVGVAIEPEDLDDAH